VGLKLYQEIVEAIGIGFVLSEHSRSASLRIGTSQAAANPPAPSSFDVA